MLVLFLTVPAVKAFPHYIWIEIPQKTEPGKKTGIRIYYGEYNEGIREKAGERLEEMNGVELFITSPSGKIMHPELEKRSDHFFAAVLLPEKGDYRIWAINAKREVMDWSKYHIGIVKPMYYASVVLQTSGNTFPLPADTSNLLISQQAGKQPSFKITFKNSPLKDAKVSVHAPGEWSKETKTDQDGYFSFLPFGKGIHVIECIYSEPVEGNFKDKKFEAIRHRATTTVIIE